MKKIFLLFVFVAIAIGNANAYDFEVEGIYYNVVSLSDLTCEVTSSGGEYSGDIVIPSSVTYNGRTLSVVSIGDDAFYGCSGLTSVTIGERVTSIGGYAFADCSYLTSVTIGEGVTSIESEAFAECFNLKSVNIFDLKAWCNIKFGYNNSNPLSHANLYLDGILVTDMNIPDEVTSIGDRAFISCSSLTSVTFPDGITSIGEYAFSGCSGLTSLTIGNGVTSIGSDVFYNCSSLTSLTVGNDYSLRVVRSSVSGTVETIVLDDDFVDDKISTYISSCSKLSKLIVKTNKKLAWSSSNQVSNAQYLNLEVIVPKDLLSYYQTADVWKNFWNLKSSDEDIETPETCEAPTITFDNTTKQLKFESATSGAKYHCTIKSDDMMTDKSNDGTAQMTGVYDITAYASADGMYNSAKVTAKLVWVNAEINTDVDVISAKTQRGVIVTTSGGSICISGTLGGETINVYNAAGSLLKSVKATGENTAVGGLTHGNVYVVKIGGTSVKVVL